GEEGKEPTPGRISRRAFMGYTAAAGALAIAGPTGCAPPSGSERQGAAGAGTGGVAPFELDGVGITELQEGMASGRWTARRLTQLYLDRIEAIDRDGPTLRSIIETNPDALTIADTLDRKRASGQLRGPMHGIPVIVKDNVATADRMTTTAGALALTGAGSPEDSWVAAKLREAGAIILGKANLSEWANFRSTRSSSGWSGRGGQCRNPYALDRNPCGSSAGSGASVSASLCAVAVGTETNGSIVCPSSANGVVGIKPTVGLWSRTRIIPISATQDTAGPMGRTVRDAATLLGACVGVDPTDARTAESEGRFHTDYTQFLDRDGLRGARIGVARQNFGFDPDVDRLMEDAITAMRNAGAEIIDPANVETARRIGGPSYQVLLYEFKHGVNAYLRALGEMAPVKSLEEVISYNLANERNAMPYFGQEILIAAQEKGGLDSQEYVESRRNALRMARAEGIDAVMDQHSLDAIISPTGGPAWTTDLVNGDHFTGGSSGPAAIAGYPNISVPAGYVFGLPVGISFFGRAWSEPTLLRIAYAFERATMHRVPPRFLPTADLTVG
ncbi:MAG: amidase, partial [Longimicrobiales bacterium]|nr:amidase [Longimicrobiales bacterium]